MHLSTHIETKLPMIRANVLVAALTLAAAAPIAFAQAPAAPGDPEKGRQKVSMCQGCHGMDGNRPIPENQNLVRKVSMCQGCHGIPGWRTA